MAKSKKVVKKGAVKNKAKAKNNKVLKSSKKRPARIEKAAVKSSNKLGIPKAAFKKSELLGTISEQSGLAKKEVLKVLEALQAVATVHLVKNGPGQFTLPGLLKMTAKTKPATKAKKGINPFTGEAMTIKAKPARRVVKVRVLKKFKNELE